MSRVPPVTTQFPQMTADRESELLREPEVKREYKLTGAWLRKNRRLKTGPPFIKLGRMVFYRRSDLDAFIAAHRVEPNGHGSREVKAQGRKQPRAQQCASA